MVDFAEMNTRLKAERESRNAFISTPLGKAFLDYENATIYYWRLDGDERASDKRLREADEKWRAAQKAFLDLLYPLAGVER